MQSEVFGGTAACCIHGPVSAAERRHRKTDNPKKIPALQIQIGGLAMLLLSKKDIESVVSMQEIIDADLQAFKMVSEKRADIPLRTRIPAPKEEGNFLFMPAYAEQMDAAALKVVNIFPHNREKNMDTAPAQILFIDGKTGYITAMLDGNYVTQVRTGAASGAAFQLLARKDASVGALFGTGSQAEQQLSAMLTACDLQEVRIFSRNQERRDAFTEKMRVKFADKNVRLVSARSSDEAIDDADVVITVTSSPVPVFDGSRIKPGCTISCIGTYEPEKHELDPAVLLRASKIYCDSVDAVLAESGDLLIPLNDGTISRNDVTGELGQLAAGQLPGRENDEEIIVFESVGVAVQDLCAAKAILARAEKSGVGTRWE